MAKPKLIVASARLPVTIARRQDQWEAITSTGGLVTALTSVAERRPFTWIGWPGTHVPEAERPAVKKLLAKHGSVPVFPGKAEIEGFYEGFSNRVLWPLFHNLTDRSHFDDVAWRAYKSVNDRFADEICRIAKPGDAVWVHDYQLARVPELLRRRGLAGPIGFFLHIPFPSAESYRTLPVRGSILRGLLGANLLAFHSYEYVSHFRNSVLRVLGVESDPEEIRLSSHRVQLAVLPIGIDPAEVEQLTTTRDAQQELAGIQTAYAGKKVIVGVDRLDYTKGIPEKLRAFEQLLKTYPKWRQRAVLVQIAAPSRTGVEEYQQLKRDVDELVGRINGRYGSSSGMPIMYLNQSVSRARLAGLYRGADIALVTPTRDGMNLVALEYVAARADLGGTLILSEFAGAAHCLPGARLVNPHSVREVAEALNDALEAPEPDRAGFGHMLDFVRENTSMTWANRFLDRLEASTKDDRPAILRLEIDEPPLIDRVHKAKRPLVLLDYDGTLRSYVLKPNDAAPDERILNVVRSLGERATVYIVSGRPQDILERWLGHLPIGLVCEHGLSIKEHGGEWETNRRVSGPTLKRVVRPLFEDFVNRTPGSTIEEKTAAIAWHYRGADPEFGVFQANQLMTQLEDTLKRRPFSVLRGARVIEVRYTENTKGHACREILKRNADADFLFVAGDDRTDEEMMEAIPPSWSQRAVTCWVGSRNAQASYWVETNEELLDQLDVMSDAWGPSGAGRRTGSRRKRVASRRRVRTKPSRPKV